MNQMLITISLLTITLLSSNFIKTHNPQSCQVKEIKYLSTYGSMMYSIYTDELKKLKNTPDEDDKIDEYTGVDSVYIPVLIDQIKYYYSDNILDGNEKKLLIKFSKIFAKIWKDETLIIKDKSERSVCKKVNLFIDKYHKISENDNEFYRMIWSYWDDGPFYGMDSNEELDIVEEILLDDKKLIIRSDDRQITLELVNQSGQLIWRKKGIGNFLSFKEKPILRKNELGYEVAIYSYGFDLQLFLKRNGEFRSFFRTSNEIEVEPGY